MEPQYNPRELIRVIRTIKNTDNITPTFLASIINSREFKSIFCYGLITYAQKNFQAIHNLHTNITTFVEHGTPITTSVNPDIPTTTSIDPDIPTTTSIDHGTPTTASVNPGIPTTTSIDPDIPTTTSINPGIPITTSMNPDIPITTSIDHNTPNVNKNVSTCTYYCAQYLKIDNLISHTFNFCDFFTMTRCASVCTVWCDNVFDRASWYAFDLKHATTCRFGATDAGPFKNLNLWSNCTKLSIFNATYDYNFDKFSKLQTLEIDGMCANFIEPQQSFLNAWLTTIIHQNYSSLRVIKIEDFDEVSLPQYDTINADVNLQLDEFIMEDCEIIPKQIFKHIISVDSLIINQFIVKKNLQLLEQFAHVRWKNILSNVIHLNMSKFRCYETFPDVKYSLYMELNDLFWCNLNKIQTLMTLGSDLEIYYCLHKLQCKDLNTIAFDVIPSHSLKILGSNTQIDNNFNNVSSLIMRFAWGLKFNNHQIRNIAKHVYQCLSRYNACTKTYKYYKKLQIILKFMNNRINIIQIWQNLIKYHIISNKQSLILELLDNDVHKQNDYYKMLNHLQQIFQQTSNCSFTIVYHLLLKTKCFEDICSQTHPYLKSIDKTQNTINFTVSVSLDCEWLSWEEMNAANSHWNHYQNINIKFKFDEGLEYL